MNNMRFCLVADDKRGNPPKGENGINLWAEIFGDYKYFGDITIDDLANYDVVMFNLNYEMIEMPIQFKKKFPQILTIGFLDGSIDEHNFWMPQKHASWIIALRTLDVIGTLDPVFIPYIQGITDKKVVFLGVPFVPPLKPRVNQEYDLLAHSGLYMQRNGLSDLIVIEKMNLRGVAFARNDDDMSTMQRLQFKNIQILKRDAYFDFLKYLAKSKICLALDARYTWGRLSLDCAAFGIPCIGTNRQYTQRILFPELTTDDPFNSLNFAVDKVNHLLNNPYYYERIITYAKKKLVEFDMESSKKRFLKIIHDYRSRLR